MKAKYKIGDVLKTESGNNVTVLDVTDKDYKVSSVTGVVPCIYSSINFVDKTYTLVKEGGKDD